MLNIAHTKVHWGKSTRQKETEEGDKKQNKISDLLRSLIPYPMQYIT